MHYCLHWNYTGISLLLSYFVLMTCYVGVKSLGRSHAPVLAKPDRRSNNVSTIEARGGEEEVNGEGGKPQQEDKRAAQANREQEQRV